MLLQRDEYCRRYRTNVRVRIVRAILGAVPYCITVAVTVPYLLATVLTSGCYVTAQPRRVPVRYPLLVELRGDRGTEPLYPLGVVATNLTKGV